MATERDGFPDERDLCLQKQAEQAVNFAEELTEWVGRHAAARRDGEAAINAKDEFELLRLRRRAANLFNSSKVPVAAAVYGASQVGKSLFMGRVLQPADNRDSPLGKCDTLSPDAYVRELSFDWDINPRSGSNEATALVTRFTTKDRFDPLALPEFPVKIRALSRSEWLRVLARGFRSECPRSTYTWQEGQLQKLFDDVYKSYEAETGNREWQMDLIDAFTYVRTLSHTEFPLEETMFNAYLSQYPLTDDGYVELASRLFWDTGSDPEIRPRITRLFREVEKFLKKIAIVQPDGTKRDGILVHWGAVRFLLDSQRKVEQGSANSRWKQRLQWSELKDEIRGGWYVIDCKPGGPPGDELHIMQSAMLEMIMPVVPHRLNGDWREVVKKMDILDLPGMVSGGVTVNKAESLEQLMMIVKRGKVFYLIERYIEECQVQTLLMLFRLGNPDAREMLQECVDKWGKTRYGEDIWPRKVQTTTPALFIGMTGIDQEFWNCEVTDRLYETRLENIADNTLGEVMKDFGGVDQPLTNVFPIRYPGTWDTNEQQRQQAGPQKWEQVRAQFLSSPRVRRYVHEPEKRWDIAMRDDDGGMSLICAGFLKCTSSVQKQDALEQQLLEVAKSLRDRCHSWHVDPDVNADRNKRLQMADKVLAWIEDEELIYDRVHALESALCFDEGKAMELAGFAEQRSSRSRRRERLEDRFPKYLSEFLKDWATVSAPQRWEQHVKQHEHGAPWFSSDDFSAFTRFLSDYLRTGDVFTQLNQRLLTIVDLPLADQGSRRFVVREYVQLVLNDFVINPGPGTEALGRRRGPTAPTSA